MTFICNECNGAMELINDNGAEFPETRVEFYKCVSCGNEQKQVL
jgi:DNA-directed RNA polymerase subunit M/transcription elongation factor TFIIS